MSTFCSLQDSIGSSNETVASVDLGRFPTERSQPSACQATILPGVGNDGRSQSTVQSTSSTNATEHPSTTPILPSSNETQSPHTDSNTSQHQERTRSESATTTSGPPSSHPSSSSSAVDSQSAPPRAVSDGTSANQSQTSSTRELSTANNTTPHHFSPSQTSTTSNRSSPSSAPHSNRRRRRVLASSAGEDSGDETEVLRRSPRIPRENFERNSEPAPTCLATSTLESREEIGTSQTENTPSRSSPSEARVGNAEWIRAHGRDQGRWLLRLHREVQSLTPRAPGDIWVTLARVRASNPNIYLAGMTEYHESMSYARKACSVAARYWKGLLPNNHPLYVRGMRRGRRPLNSEGRYEGFSDNEEEAEQSERDARRRSQVVSLITEDEGSDNEEAEEHTIAQELDPADWVLSAGILMKNVSPYRLDDDIPEQIQTQSSTSTHTSISPTPSPPSTSSNSPPSSSSSHSTTARQSTEPTPQSTGTATTQDPNNLSQPERAISPQQAQTQPSRRRRRSPESADEAENTADEQQVRRRRRRTRLATEDEEDETANTHSSPQVNFIADSSSQHHTPSTSPPPIGRVRFAEDQNAANNDEDTSDDDFRTPATTDVLPDSSVLPQNEGGNVEYDGEDFRRLRAWLDTLPGGRTRSERSLLNLQDRTLLQGGSVGVLRGVGEAELGSAEVDLDGFDVDWESDLRSLEQRFARQDDWTGIRLWELIPEGCRGFLGRTPSTGVAEAGSRLIPRSIWRPPVLRRTSQTLCVGCLCVDLAERESYIRQVRRWSRGVTEGTLQSWRHKRERVNHFTFRCHTCGLSDNPTPLWRGLLSQTERGCSGQSEGWEASFRVFVSASIPSGFPHQYCRGLLNIDVVFPIPTVFRVMLGEAIRMHGRLRWEGLRPSRGQPMGFTWLPAAGDAEGLTGPVQFSRWNFVSDFVYGLRPDVEIRSLSIQVCSIVGVDSRTAVLSSQVVYQAPLIAIAARLDRNSRRLRERTQNRAREVSSDENADAYAGRGALTRRERRRQRREDYFESRTLSLTQPPSSSYSLRSNTSATTITEPSQNSTPAEHPNTTQEDTEQRPRRRRVARRTQDSNFQPRRSSRLSEASASDTEAENERR